MAVVGNSQTIYGLPFTSAQTPFFTAATIGATGLQYTPYSGGNYGTPTNTGNQVISDGTPLYTSSGQIWDPVAQRQTGTFLTTRTGAVLAYTDDPALTLDPSGSAIFAIGQENTTAYTEGDVFPGYNLRTLQLTGSLAFPNLFPGTRDLARWGPKGYAFLAAGAGLTDTELYVGLSSTISAAVASQNPSPLPTVVSPTQAAAGSSSLTLTVTGSSLLPSSTVAFNGSGLVTTFVSSTELQATPPAASLALQGAASVTVVNPAPGGGTSAALPFSITAATSIAPAITFSVGNQTFGAAPFQVSATSTSSASITYSVVSGPATLAANTVTLTGRAW